MTSRKNFRLGDGWLPCLIPPVIEQPDALTPELLAPAGNWDCVRAAAAAGADAVYFGLSRFNARLRADNFTEADLPELMTFLHRHGMRGFVAMNTLIFTDELDAAREQLRLLAEAGVDALIIQDLGLAALAREIAPAVELHASTQMTITSPEGLAFVETLFPLERAVLGRELSVKEIGRFHQTQTTLPTRAPLEVFVHGALCVAYSGQCLTSESLGQRSANRGECAQACRMPYELVVDGVVRELGEVRYLLSPQDLAAVELIPDLLQAGVKSFKIEGRLKSPEYVAAVTRVYRKALDAAQGNSDLTITADDRYALEMTFSRGLSNGWLAGTNHPGLTHGRFGKKRGPLLGTIAACGPGWVELDTDPEPPLKAGDGVVFDAGENRDHEQGARIWKMADGRMLFHRTHSGLDFRRISPGMKVFKTSDPQLEAELKQFWKNAKPSVQRMPVDFTAEGAPGEPLRLTATANGTTVQHVSSQPLASAERQALDEPLLHAQLGKLGETRFSLRSVTNHLRGQCFFPLASLNALRREVIAELDQSLAAASPPSHTSVRPASEAQLLLDAEIQASFPTANASLSVLCRTDAQLSAAIAERPARILLDYEDPRRYREAVEEFRRAKLSDCHLLLATPRILKPGETGYLKLIDRCEPDGLLLRNLAALWHYRHDSSLLKVGDFSLNVANPITAALLRQHAGLERLTISYDLNIQQVLALLHAAPPQWFELTLHQHMPMFHMEHCVFCTFLSKGTSYKDCGRPCETHVVHLRDRVGQLHRLHADVGCRNTLFNGRAQTGANFLSALHSAGLRHFRVEMLDESTDQARSLIRSYQQLLRGEIDATTLLRHVTARQQLGVTEGTLSVV